MPHETMAEDSKSQFTRRNGSRVDALRSRPEFRGSIDPLEAHDSAEHLALIFETREQQFETVVPFVEQGLARGERCLYITNEGERANTLDTLRAGGIDVDTALEKGALNVRSITDTYLSSGEFVPDEMLDFYTDVLEDAVTEYEGLRVTAESGWIADDDTVVEDVLEYEARVNDVLRDTDGIALCQYNRKQFPDEVISEIIETHPHIVHENTISQNVFYTPPTQFLNRERSRDRNPDRMLAKLLDISDTILDRRELGNFFRDLHFIVAELDRSFEETLRELIQRGCERFNHDFGVMARVDPDTGQFEITQTTGDHDYFHPDTTLPLSETYCTTADTKSIIDPPGSVVSEETDVTVLREFGLQTYLGTHIRIDDGHNRVFFFVSSQPRQTPISDAEVTFHYFLGRWVKREREDRHLEIPNTSHNAASVRWTRVNELVREIVHALVEKPTRPEIERVVCNRLAESTDYEAAWMGEKPLSRQRISHSYGAGIDDESVRAFTDADTSQSIPTLPERVLESGQPEAVRIRDDPAFDPCRRQLRKQGIESLVALPIAYENLCYGVLVVCAGGTEAFDEHHRTVLAELGKIVGFAIAAVERKKALVSDEIVELELRISDPTFCFVRLTAETETAVTLDGHIIQSDGSSIVYATTTGASAETIQECATTLSNIEHVRLIDDHEQDQKARFEFVMSASTVIETFAEYGAAITAATASNGEATLEVELPQTANIRSVVDAVQATFSGTEVVAKRNRDRSGEIARGSKCSFHDLLTDKQREVVQAAYFAGYFDRPRRITGDEIAATLDISSSTFHQHLQAGLQKLLTATLEERNSR